MTTIVQAAYIVSALLFIMALAGLSKHETAKTGNAYGVTGMAIAIVATIYLALKGASAEGALGVPAAIGLIVLAMAIGAVIGLWRAKSVEMTQMPELIAILHSLVGAAAVLVGYNSFLTEKGLHDVKSALELTGSLATIHSVEVFLGVFIGAVTLTGSVVAFLKLSTRISSKPLTLPQRHKMNLAALLISAGLMVWFVSSGSVVPLLIMTVISLALGWHLVAVHRRRRHACRHLDAQLVLRVGGSRSRLHARQRPADRRRRARRILRCDPELHHVPCHGPLVHQRHRRRIRWSPREYRAEGLRRLPRDQCRRRR